ncbi:MAG: GAF domain-containing protein [Candidatus Promineofilum sp.]|nr:GAF domain-containing protein [Promineifilum sp.]MCW5865268.1 GAF domain-containing protein [Anaerolineae bacterium]
MAAAHNQREAHPRQQQLNVLALLQELGVIANGSLSVGDALYQSLAAIGRHTSWRLGRVKLESAVMPLVSEPAISWSNDGAVAWPSLPETVMADGAPTVVAAPNGPLADSPPLRGYVACPIHAADQRVGLLEFLADEPLQIGPELRQVLSHTATLLGLVIERGRIQAGLRESERRFRAIFDQSYQFIGLMEPDGTLIEVNQTALQFGGLTLADVVGKPFWEAYWWQISPTTQARLKAAIQRAARGELVHYDVEVQGAGGRVITIDFSIKPIHNLSGEVVLLIPEGRDITEMRATLESLKRAEARLAKANSVGQVVAATFDLEQIYREVLNAAREMLGAGLVLLFEYDQDKLHIRAASHDDGLDIGRGSVPADAGVAGEVWTTGRPVWLSGEECRRRRSEALMRLTGYTPQAMLTVPVRWQDQVVGVLQAVDTREDAFLEGDLDSLQALGTWTAIAMGKARQHASLERRLHESEAIAQISRALAETLEPENILELIAVNAQRIAPRTDWTVIHLLRGRPEKLFPAASAGDAPPAEAYVITPGQGIAWQALSEGHLVNVADVREDTRASAFARAAGVRSMLVAPIQSRNRPIGTISSVSRTPQTFTAEDERLLTILASQAAMAIENTQLFDSQRRARTVAEQQRERLRELTQRLVTAQEDERLRISRELHDEAGQALTSLKISLDLLRSGLPAEQESLRARLADVAGLADETMETLRTLAHDLRPPGLDAFGLNVALEGLCYDFSARTALPVRYHGLDLPELPTAVALSMYRLVQEALTNTAKHAEATQVVVNVARGDGQLELSIADNGKGFPAEADAPRQRGGIGLVSMRERAELLGGTLDIETSPGQGTRLIAGIPLERAEDGELS